MFCSSVVFVILQGPGAAKYKSCSRAPHSELMKSGPAQERAGHAHWVGCGGFYCTDSRINKVRREWIQNTIVSTRQPSLQTMRQNNIAPEHNFENRDYNGVTLSVKTTDLNELDHNVGQR